MPGIEIGATSEKRLPARIDDKTRFIYKCNRTPNRIWQREARPSIVFETAKARKSAVCTARPSLAVGIIGGAYSDSRAIGANDKLEVDRSLERQQHAHEFPRTFASIKNAGPTGVDMRAGPYFDDIVPKSHSAHSVL